MNRIVQILFCVCSIGQFQARESKFSSPDYFIIDSWICGYIGGFVHGKGARFSWAWKEAMKRSKHDAKIWGGLFMSDTNQTRLRRFGEVSSRFVYQTPQTLGGFLVGQAYSTFTGKMNDIRYANGSVVMNLNVTWPGVCLGTYILAKKSISAQPNNKMFQHEYGHYLQSKRMGWAYFVRVGLPAILSKGDHDAHPVEIDCNREAFIYFNRFYPNFQNDSLITDNKGWNFRFNPFPDSIGECRFIHSDSLSYIDALSTDESKILEPLKVSARFLDYASWILIPAPVIVGLVNAKRYNKALGVLERK
jgi:hypothetical protein